MTTTPKSMSFFYARDLFDLVNHQEREEATKDAADTEEGESFETGGDTNSDGSFFYARDLFARGNHQQGEEATVYAPHTEEDDDKYG